MKSFSWTLALRYLNPLRTFVSIITLISLLGVSFGVMVLIVVLSVHAGFERNLKEILLGFAPHVRVESRYGSGISGWEELELELAKEPGVEGAYALIEGYVLLDTKGWRQPVAFRAINTENETQVKALEELLDVKDFPESRADMGLDEVAVISRQLADGLGLQVGDKLRLLASSNIDSVMGVYRVSQQDSAWDIYQDELGPFEEALKSLFTVEGDEEVVKSDELTAEFRKVQVLLPLEETEGEPMRTAEREILEEVLFGILNEPVRKDDGGNEYFEKGTQGRALAKLAELKEIDLEKADLEAFKEIEEFVLPKEVTVYGVYHDTKRAQGPHAFVPLSVGQELKGLGGMVEAIGIRTEDPYHADVAAKELAKRMGDEWFVRSWMDTHAQQFQLVKTEKIMMSFALSFITLLSAFSIMAVMYTVTVQKRQEIGVMKALGARPIQIVNVFLYQGLIVGVCGSLLGLGMGLLAIRFRENIVDGLRAVGVDPFPPDFHGMTELPARVIPDQLVVICVVAVVLCLLAALVPAMMAAFRDPAKSLRNL
ncbi:MAG: FtsX-like permease family protein [Verrucomicrobiaceae bacterium]